LFSQKEGLSVSLSAPVYECTPAKAEGRQHPLSSTEPNSLRAIFPGDSAVSQLARAHPWEATSLGDPRAWPEALRIPLRMMLTSRFEMWLGWGPDLAFFYNDAYIPTLGAKHPRALGEPMAVVWREIFADVHGRIQSVLRDNTATWDKALMLLLERHGYPEETYHTFSYSPLLGEDGTPQGVMCVVTEETERVINERRMATLRTLAASLLGPPNAEAVFAGLRAAMDGNRRDFPFGLVYLRQADGRWILHGSSDPFPGQAGAPQPRAPDAGWPLAAIEQGSKLERFVLESRHGLPTGSWPLPPAEAIAVPIARSGADRPIGALILGLNPYRPQDEEIGAFAQLIAGQIAGALGHVDALESERRRADRVWLNSRDLITVADRDGVFVSVSPSWTRILGHTPAEMLGRRLIDFIHPEDAAAERLQLELRPGPDGQASFENRYVSKSGEPRWIAWNTRLEGGLIYANGRDITENRLQADALAVAEAALRQSQKMEAVGQLTGGIAHDFNNLLAGITGSLELLQSRLAQGRVSELDRYAAAAQGAAQRAAALTHRLLAFSRQQTLDPKPTNVNRLVLGMEELIRRSMGPHITVEAEPEADLWATLLDPNQLENALLNLCINARDAMPDGGRLTVATANICLDEGEARERDLSPGPYITLCVTDTGTGMTPGVAARAIDPFFTTKPMGQGTGLGLSMVYGFVRQSGGQLRIDTEPGQGTTLCLYLPRHHGSEEAGPALPARAAMRPKDQTATVLVVDDEPSIRMLITEILHEFGYAALEAQDGASGLAILESAARIDLLISDVGLPGGMNGRQMADRALLLRPDLRVLFITGYAENAVVGNGQLAPGMHVLTKPFAMDVLAERVRSLMAE
jgi:PAS domain S-box-containing protein